MKLFYSYASPFARKAMVLADELGLKPQIEYEIVNPWEDSALRGFNPFSQIPTLVLDDGLVLHDSPVICDWFNDLSGGKAIPAAGIARARALRLQALGDGVCNSAVRKLREIIRPREERHVDVIERQQAALTAALDVLERDAGMLGPGFGLGEVSVACALGYLDLRFPKDNWRDGRAKLAAWYETVGRRPSMVATEPPKG